jgi:hypothetical protein
VQQEQSAVADNEDGRRDAIDNGKAENAMAWCGKYVANGQCTVLRCILLLLLLLFL